MESGRPGGYTEGIFHPRDSAISLHVGHSGYRLGLRPGTQIFPHSAFTAVPLTIPSTTDAPADMKSPSSGLNPSSTMWDIRSWSPSSSGSTWVGATVIPVSVMPPGSRIRRPATRPPPGTAGAASPRPLTPYALAMPARSLVLASGSPARLRLLRDAGFDPKVVVSGIDERSIEDEDTAVLVATLARRKAEAVADRSGDAVVVGCDSMLEFDGRQFGKPSSPAEAKGWLQQMRGRTATLFTGHCVIDESSGRQVTGVAGTAVRFGVTTDAELDAYLASGEAMAVAGAFTLDGRSAPFIDGVDGDPGNVIGLSLPLLRSLLAGLDIGIVDLWTGNRP
jgi:septum formation protein